MDAPVDPWSLRERPFEPVTDARFFFQSREHEEALARLRYLAEEETMYLGMLSGEIGCGKSLTRQVFSARLNPDRHVLIQFENSAFALDDLLRRLLADLGLGASASEQSSHGLYELMRSALYQVTHTHQRHLVLIFDEAQDMSLETLTGLKRLSNLNDEKTGRLTIILIGQPELRQLVSRLPALDQRISLRFHLKPMTSDDTPRYLRHRLRTAGHSSGDLFTAEAAELLHQASRGVAREINRLAKLSLEMARQQNAEQISSRHVSAVIEDLRRYQNMPLVAVSAA
jgi:general secretion pathway protein A